LPAITNNEVVIDEHCMLDKKVTTTGIMKKTNATMLYEPSSGFEFCEQTSITSLHLEDSLLQMEAHYLQQQ